MADDTQSQYSKPLDTAKLQGTALKLGIAGVAVCVIAILMPQYREQAFLSYLIGFSFWVSIALGCFSLQLLQNVTGGRWGISLCRPFEAAAATLPWMAVLFVPVILGAGILYEWATPEAAHDHIISQKAPYLNLPFFVFRAALYFGIWTVIIRKLQKLGRAQDAGQETTEVGFTRLSAPCMVVYALTATFASFDWLMSLEPHWFSTMYGVRFAASAALGGMAFSVLALSMMRNKEPMKSLIQKDLSPDLGNLMLAFTMFWAYIAFSEFLIIWSANLPEETPWFLNRMEGGWEYIGVSLLALHFGLPFVLLLSRNIKKRLDRLARVAVWVLIMRFVDMIWLVTPSHSPCEFHIHLLDFAALIGIGGLWLWFFLRNLSSRPLIAYNSARVKQILNSKGDSHHG